MRARRLLVVAALCAAAVVLPAEAAAAHGVGGIEPTNYLVRIRQVDPPVEGLSARVIDLGNSLEVRNETGGTVVVLGYDDEPYLRLRGDGVWRNDRSPATYWNQRTTPGDAPPERYDADAEPEWVRISHDPVARWHDHRAHWMGEPPGGARRVLDEWTITLELTPAGTLELTPAGTLELTPAGGEVAQRVEITGETVWVPPSSPWPWVGVAAVVAGLTVALGRSRRPGRVRVLLACALTLLVALSAGQIAGEWSATERGIGSRLAAEAYLLGGVALGGAAAWRVARSAQAHDATPLALLAGVTLLVAGGLVGLPALGRSQLPTTLPAPVARALVAATLGLGVGVIVVAAGRLRPPQTPAGARMGE